jgi:hypothetical protein
MGSQDAARFHLEAGIMLRAFFFSAAVLLTAAASAQQAASLKSLPAADGLPVGVVQSDVSGQWIVIGPGFVPIQPQLLDGGKVALWCGEPGRYLAYQIVAGEQPRPASVILGGKVGPEPKPKPQPDPKPKPKPDPKPTPVKTPFCVIVEESSTRPADPGIRSIFLGGGIQRLFLDSKWLAPDGFPSYQIIDRNAVFGQLDATRAAWLRASIDAAVTTGKPLPVLVWSAGPADKPTVEPLQKDEAAQIARIKAIAGAK